MDHANPRNLVLRPREAAQALGISERTLWSLTAPRGPLPCVKIGRSVRYCPDALKAYLASQSADSAE